MPKKEDYEQQESMLTLREVEEMLGISRQALHNIRKAGLLKGMRVGLRAACSYCRCSQQEGS